MRAGIEGIKARDILGSVAAEQPSVNSYSFSVYFFDIAAERYSGVCQSIQKFSREPIVFQSRQLFEKNGFVLGFGRGRGWDEFSVELEGAGADMVHTVNLGLLEDLSDEVFVKILKERRPVFYRDKIGELAAVEVGPGEAVLKFRAERLLGLRGVCRLFVEPAIKAERDFAKPTEDLYITNSGFEVRISPYEFFVIGPDIFDKTEASLKGLMFCRTQPKATVRICVVACVGIVD